MSTQDASADHVPTLDATGTTTARPRRRANWSLWAQWTIATTMGWTLGALVYFGILFGLESLNSSLLVGLVGTGQVGLLGASIGLVAGLLQGFSLRRSGYSLHHWLRNSLLGHAVAAIIGTLSAIVFAFALAAIDASSIAFNLILGMFGAVAGLVLGYFQINAISQRTPSMAAWQITSAIAWAAGCIASELVNKVLSDTYFWPISFVLATRSSLGSAIAAAAACGFTGGAITGIPLARMLRQSESI